MTTRKHTDESLADEERRIMAEGALITDIQVAMHESLEALGWSRRQLAVRLHVSESQVSHYFAPSANLTVKTVARIFNAMSDECVVTSRRLEAMRLSLRR